MGRKRIKRRQSHGSAWHWNQTDAWYYTRPKTKKRLPLFDETGARIYGKENREAAELALAREKLTWATNPNFANAASRPLNVARVCSDYIQYCEKGLAKGEISKSHCNGTKAWLKDLCHYCGAKLVAELRVQHVTDWLEKHSTWKSSETRRGVIAIIQAAFNRAAQELGVANPLKGLKKPQAKPRLASFSPQEEQALYDGTEPAFREFLFAAIHTGLRPFCELAKLTADAVEESPRGMMWRVYATKTDKPRKVPVRPEVAELTKKLMKTAPRGSGLPLFRNTKGRPWKPANGVVRFLNLKKKLGWYQDAVKGKYSCYTARHTFVHRMLSGYWNNGAGCSIETVAELIGDTPKVAFDHYGREWSQHYQDPLWRAIGNSENTEGKSVQLRSKKSGISQKSPVSTKPKRTGRSAARARRSSPTAKSKGDK